MSDESFFTATPAEGDGDAPAEDRIELKDEVGQDVGYIHVERLATSGKAEDHAAEGAERAHKAIDEAAKDLRDFVVLIRQPGANPGEPDSTAIIGAFNPGVALEMAENLFQALGPVIVRLLQADNDNEGSPSQE